MTRAELMQAANDLEEAGRVLFDKYGGQAARPVWKVADRLREATYGPRPACRECGMGGDVGGTEPNPIPF